jgi:hypothetical protein
MRVASPAPAIAEPDPSAIVAANYPHDLAAQLAKDGADSPENRQQAYVLIPASGADYIVAAYSNKIRGAVVLLQKTATGYTSAQIISSRLGDREPHVDSLDIDGDGVPEAVVTYEYGMRPEIETHIYRLVDGRLVLISPTERHGNSAIGYPHFLNLGNGVLDLVNDRIEGTREKPFVVHEHYVFSNGAYVAAAALDYYKVFYRDEGEPGTSTSKIVIPAAAIGKPFRFVVVNGGSSGKEYRVSSAKITLNGVTLASPSDFSEQRGSWTIPVSLQQSNTLTVQLDGKPRSRIAVAIKHD